MKRKYKKLANEMANYLYEMKSPSNPKEESSYENLINNCEYDMDVSNKFKDFVIRLLKFDYEMLIEVSSYGIEIRCNLNKIYRDMNSNYTSILSNGNHSKKSYPEDYSYLRINLKKNVGFSLNKDDIKSISFNDPNMYDILFNDIKKKYNEICKLELNHIIDDIMVKTKLSRDSNLDKLLE